MKTVVIYHRADFDGIFCREIAKKFLPEAELIGWDYSDATPVIPDDVDSLFMLDISVEPLMNHPKLVWIDHHKSAMDKYSASIHGYRIDGVAACRLAWQFFTHEIATKVMSDASYLPNREEYIDREVDEPFAVRLAGEYDIWDRRDERAELFQNGLRSQDLTEADWAELLDPKQTIGFAAKVQKLLFAGRGIQYAKQKENESIIGAFGFTTTLEGLKFLACNHARCDSLLFTACVKLEHDALLGFNWTGKHWRVSLYHAPGKEHHDLSGIAQKFGGGGHRGACGFTCDRLPFAL